ncbi:MAG: ribbon-helix-helix domain-containing protein [Acidimicrobiales bacterium]
MTQLVARVDDHLVDGVDALVAAGIVQSRSEAVRIALTALVDQHRREGVAKRIVQSYTDRPQTTDELTGLDEATRALVEEEPW